MSSTYNTLRTNEKLLDRTAAKAKRVSPLSLPAVWLLALTLDPIHQLDANIAYPFYRSAILKD